MEAKAIIRHLRVPARKVRVVAREVQKKSVNDALDKLAFLNKAAAPHLIKVIKSAAANASKNFGADADKLIVKQIVVDHGPTLKYARRFMPRAQGRAAKLNKRSCHVTAIVTDNK
ncbi:MAG: 50S ribosomal protein L22 [Spirochaetia bacterium]|nr:50S ribosomal protein L22 [Spirochaetia bacterium]